jgi:hypothetical protein
MIDRIEMPPGVLGFRISGEVSRDDYEQVLIPALREVIEGGGEIRCFCQVGPEFEGYEAGAMWEDLKTGFDYGVGHHSSWKRLALVTDVEWIRHAAALFGWMAPGEMKTFALAEAEQARAWVAG